MSIMRGCKGKIKYITEETAELAIYRIRKKAKKDKRHKQKTYTLNSYKCKKCGFWHVGHNKYDMEQW